MTLEALRMIERAHGVTAWLAAGALVLAAWTTVRGRSARLAGGAALALTLVTAALGLALHDPYRLRLRQRIFLDSAALGWLFERKQHLAFAAVLLACAGLASILAASRAGGEPGSADLVRASRLAWIASAIFAIAASIASSVVARHATF